MSASWMGGYVSDVTYTLGFYRELSPAFLTYVCESNGVRGPSAGRRLRYCELGCGRGYGTALLAAANPDMDFVGIDFNPTHIAEAQSFADKVGLANLTFLESSFGDAVASSDPVLDDFDFVTLHGVLTWVGPEAQREIVDFLRTRLRPGGIAYVSYNTYPGWAAITPLQHMIREVAARSTGDSIARINRAREVLTQLAQPGCAYTAQNPAVRSRIQNLAQQNTNYLVHEFLHDKWSPIYVTQAFEKFHEAKLTFIGSASIGENRLSFAVPKDMHEMVNSATDLAMREQLKDFAANKQFRRDVYVKGPIALTTAEQRQAFERTRFALTSLAAGTRENWKVPTGDARPKDGLVATLAARLGEGSATGAELVERARPGGFTEKDVQIVLELLVHNSAVLPCRPDGGEGDQSAARRFNAAVCAMASVADTHRYLAAPVAGSAIAAGQFERLALPALLADLEAPATEVAARVLREIEASGQKMRRGERALGPEDTPELAEMIDKLRKGALPLWRHLGVTA